MIELWRDRPNNFQLLWDFFTAPHLHSPLHQAIQTAADALTIMPFGNEDYATALPRNGFELGLGGRPARRRAPRRAGPGLATPSTDELGAGRRLACSAAGLGTLSLWQSAGPIFIRYAVWLAFVPMSFLLAIGVALLAPPGPRHRAGRRRSPTGAVAHCRRRAAGRRPRCGRGAVVTGALPSKRPSDESDRRRPPAPARGPKETRQPRKAGCRRCKTPPHSRGRPKACSVRPTDGSSSRLRTSSLWPYAAGMVLELDEHGVQSTVSPASWELYFGHERAPDRRVDVTFDLYASSDAAARNASRGTVIADLHGEVLTYQRT